MTRIYDDAAIEESFTRFLSDGKFRKTPERFAILRKALEMNDHFEVDALHHAIEKEGYHVSRATVYNTVELLEKAGILHKNEFSHNSASYEVCRNNHIHLVCQNCGSIKEIENNHLIARIRQEVPDSFHPETVAVTVYGICSDCYDPNSH